MLSPRPLLLLLLVVGVVLTSAIQAQDDDDLPAGFVHEVETVAHAVLQCDDPRSLLSMRKAKFSRLLTVCMRYIHDDDARRTTIDDFAGFFVRTRVRTFLGELVCCRQRHARLFAAILLCVRDVGFRNTADLLSDLLQNTSPSNVAMFVPFFDQLLGRLPGSMKQSADCPLLWAFFNGQVLPVVVQDPVPELNPDLDALWKHLLRVAHEDVVAEVVADGRRTMISAAWARLLFDGIVRFWRRKGDSVPHVILALSEPEYRRDFLAVVVMRAVPVDVLAAAMARRSFRGEYLAVTGSLADPRMLQILDLADSDIWNRDVVNGLQLEHLFEILTPKEAEFMFQRCADRLRSESWYRNVLAVGRMRRRGGQRRLPPELLEAWTFCELLTLLLGRSDSMQFLERDLQSAELMRLVVAIASWDSVVQRLGSPPLRDAASPGAFDLALNLFVTEPVHASEACRRQRAVLFRSCLSAWAAFPAPPTTVLLCLVDRARFQATPRAWTRLLRGVLRHTDPRPEALSALVDVIQQYATADLHLGPGAAEFLALLQDVVARLPSTAQYDLWRRAPFLFATDLAWHPVDVPLGRIVNGDLRDLICIVCERPLRPESSAVPCNLDDVVVLAELSCRVHYTHLDCASKLTALAYCTVCVDDRLQDL